MALRDSLIAEYDHEAQNTRRMLERVPADALGWAPHAKSPTMGWLAAHLMMLPGWGVMTLNITELDLASPEMQQRPAIPATPAEIVANYDAGVAAFRDALVIASDEILLQPWTLRMGDKVIFTLPRAAVLRSMIFNHTVHHRAQLGVYLRLKDVPVPSTYGPSADDGGM